MEKIKRPEKEKEIPALIVVYNKLDELIFWTQEHEKRGMKRGVKRPVKKEVEVLEKIMLQFLLKYEKMDKAERKVLIDILVKMTSPVIIINNKLNQGE